MKYQAPHVKIQTIWGWGKAKAKHFAQIRVFWLWQPILVKALACKGQVARSGRDPTSKKLYNRVTATVIEIKIWNFQDLVYYQVPTTCISRIFYIDGLRSGQFRDLPTTYT